MTTVEGKFGFKATVLKDSISPAGIRMRTFEIEYWRGILAELNTHRMLSKNSASSRAIPFEKMKQQLTGRPVRFGAANPGMQDTGVDARFPIEIPGHPHTYYNAEDAWGEARADALCHAESLFDAGYHKQVYNRLTEPFQMMKTVVSYTEGNNLFWLRDHGAADPSFQELARVMRLADEASTPTLLQPGEWHLPYVEFFRGDGDSAMYRISNDMAEPLTTYGFVDLDTAIKVSTARCAAVSFRNVDYGVSKSIEVFNRLVGDARKHASAFEHQATPMEAPRMLGLGDDGTGLINVANDPFTWEPGVSHSDRNGQLWSGNLRGWVQHRKLIDGENIPG